MGVSAAPAVRVGTRGSKLALTQTTTAAEAVAAAGGFTPELVTIRTESTGPPRRNSAWSMCPIAGTTGRTETAVPRTAQIIPRTSEASASTTCAPTRNANSTW